MTATTHRRWRWATMALLTLPLFGFDRGCVSSPVTDTIVTTSSKDVKGTIGRHDNMTGKWVENVSGWARLRVNGGSYRPWSTTDANNFWTQAAVPLSLGVNTLDGQTSSAEGGGTTTGAIDAFILEWKDDLPNRGTQLIFLDFSDTAVDTQIKNIASGTLTGPLTPAQLTQFVVDVKAEIRSFIASAYSGTGVSLVTAAGTDVHKIVFHGENKCGLFGQSPGDYKNQTKAQTSHVYVGSFKCSMVDDGELIASTPAKLTDTLAARVKDVGTAIGRTAAHEAGHSFGLTAEGESKLHGCEGFHNCKSYDNTHPSDRFDDGHHIMDPGPRSLMHARIGQANKTTRLAQKPKFEAYGKSYLRIIHP